MLRVRDDVLVVQTLLWPDEVRAAEFAGISDDVEISDKELKMAVSLVDSFAADFKPEDFVDEYRGELEQMIDAKLEGGDAFPAEEKAEGEDAEVLDLLAALQRSVERQKGGAAKPALPNRRRRRREAGGEEGGPGREGRRGRRARHPETPGPRQAPHHRRRQEGRRRRSRQARDPHAEGQVRLTPATPLPLSA